MMHANPGKEQTSGPCMKGKEQLFLQPLMSSTETKRWTHDMARMNRAVGGYLGRQS